MKKLIAVAVLAAFSSLPYAAEKDITTDVVVVGQGAAGTYLEAATILAALTKKSPEGSSYLGGCEKPLKEKDAAFLQKVAWDTVKGFYGWK